MAEPVTIRPVGLRKFQRALRKADKRLATQLQRDFKEIAREVAADARTRAGQRRKSGDEVRGIKPFSRQGAVGVASAATHRGFRYSARLEYEDRAGGRFGPRAVLWPAFLDHDTKFEAEALQLFEDLAKDETGDA